MASADSAAAAASFCVERRHRLVAEQRKRPLVVQIGDFQLGLGALKIGARLGGREFVRTLVDREQEIVLFDDVTVLEMD
jgi:hypothetical protein